MGKARGLSAAVRMTMVIGVALGLSACGAPTPTLAPTPVPPASLHPTTPPSTKITLSAAAPNGSVWAQGWNGQADGRCCLTHICGLCPSW